MGNSWAPVINVAVAKNLVANFNQNAGTYNAGVVSGGDILIKSVTCFVTDTALSLTSVSVATDNATADTILGSTAAGNLTAGRKQTPVTTPVYLPNSKHIQYTIVGNGTGGAMNICVEYYPLSPGATIS